MKNWPQGVIVVPMAAIAVRSQRLLSCALRDDGAVERRAPVGLGQEAGDEVGDVDGGERQEDALHLAVAAARHQEPDAEGDRRHGQPRRDVREAEGRGDARELGHGRAEVGDQEGEHRERRHPEAELLADERREALAGHGAHARAHLLRHAEDGRDQQQQPQHAVAVARADHRPRGDAAGVVVGGGGDEARPEDREEDHQAAAADAADEPAAYVAWRLRHRGLLNGRSSAGASSRRAEAPGRWHRRS